MRTKSLTVTSLVLAGAVLASCSSVGSSPSAAAPSEAAPSEAAPSEAAPSSAAAVTVEATEVGSLGTVLVAGSNGMTVYTFTMDVKDSGESNCTGDCLVNWPALTVEAGETPSGGSGVSGALGTITRTDDSSIQVTYNGLPLYFYIGDEAPGDSNGVYTDWEPVTP